MGRCLPSQAKYRTRDGFTILELLIVLVMIGILAAIGASRFGTNSARAYTNDLQALFQQARFEAIKRNAPVAVIWSVTDRSFSTVYGNQAKPCDGTEVLMKAESIQYPRLNVTTDFGDGEGLVWLPSGQARSCAFTVFAKTIANIQDEKQVRLLTVTLTGKVTVE